MQFVNCRVLVLSILVLAPGYSAANVSPPVKPLELSQKYQQAEAKRKLRADQRKAEAAIPKVDINNASLDALKNLPGIDDALAAKIIAGRPYGSKTWLVTNGVIAPEIYGGIKKLVAAGQPSKEDAAKKPEVFGNRP
jgi:competence protein ComEA